MPKTAQKTCIFDALLCTKVLVWGVKVLALIAVLKHFSYRRRVGVSREAHAKAGQEAGARSSYGDGDGYRQRGWFDANWRDTPAVSSQLFSSQVCQGTSTADRRSSTLDPEGYPGAIVPGRAVFRQESFAWRVAVGVVKCAHWDGEKGRGMCAYMHRQECDEMVLAMLALSRYNSLMATILIRDLDDKVKRSLQIRAATSGRSMEAEARAILTAIVNHVPTAEMPVAKAATEKKKKLGAKGAKRKR